jgi:hypothetical protein
MKKKENIEPEYYVFNPSRTLSLEEVTLLLKKVVGHWRMNGSQYRALPAELKDVFVPEKE